IVLLTVVVSALCLYYLSFTLVSNSVEKKADAYAMDESGNIDFTKRQTYLDSVWRQPVYNFLGAKFTYQEVKETELGQGLDIQGGMQVTLAISPVRSEEHTSELQSRENLVCRLLLEKKKTIKKM